MKINIKYYNKSAQLKTSFILEWGISNEVILRFAYDIFHKLSWDTTSELPGCIPQHISSCHCVKDLSFY